MKSTSSRKTGKTPKRRIPRNPADGGHLAQLDDQLKVNRFTLRFVTTTNFGGNFGVTYANLLDAWLIAGTATNGYQLFDFVRIRRVTIIAAAPAYNTSSPMTTVGVEFFGLNSGQLGSGVQATDTALGLTAVARVSLAPSPGSQAAQWQASSTVNAFAVRAVDVASNPVAGVVIEVTLDYKNSADVNSASVGTAIAGATPGHLYYGGLDGLRLANTMARSVFIPRI